MTHFHSGDTKNAYEEKQVFAMLESKKPLRPRLLIATAAAALLSFSTFPAHASAPLEEATAYSDQENHVTSQAGNFANGPEAPASSSQEMSGTESDDGSVVYTGEEAQLTVTNTSQSSIQTNRSVHYSEGPADFQGWAQGEISPPAGYELVGPPVHDDWGDTSHVNCNSSADASEGSGELTESIRVTFVRSDRAE